MLLRNFNILTGDPENREVFSRPPLVAYRRDSNLRDMLVRTFDSSPPSPWMNSDEIRKLQAVRDKLRHEAHKENSDDDS